MDAEIIDRTVRETELAAENAKLRQQLAVAEQRARDGDDRYGLILNSAVDYGIVAIDLDGLVTEWNEGACRIMGWPAAEMLGKPAAIFFTDEDRRAGIPQQEMTAALEHGRGTDERWHLRKDGSRFWANGEMMPLKDAAGVVQGFIKILRDRTAQRRDAEKTRADAEFLSSVLASSGDCIKVLDLDGKLTFMNEGGLRIMEVSDFNAIRGCPWLDFWQGTGLADAKVAMAMAQRGEVGRFQGVTDTMAGNPKWWDVQVTPILGSDGRPERILSVSRDITATKLNEARRAALSDLSDQLAKRDDTASLTDLACGILGEALGVQLVGYGLVDAAAETITVERDWTTGGALSLAGTLSFRDFGSYIDDLKRDQTVVVNDARQDARTKAFAAALEARSARAFVNTPVFENGTFVALQYVSSDKPRDWTEGDLLFIRDVALRMRAETARREAEAALQASESRFRTILDTVEAAFAIVEVKFDADDRPVDYCFVEANPAFERQAGVNLRGKWVTEFAPNLEQFWFETYGHVAKTGEPASFENYAEAFERWFDVRAVRVDDPADRRIAILFNDVTARRVAEERLRESEAVARQNIERVQLALAAGAIIGTWFWDIQADRFTVDEAFARSFGLDPAIGRDGIPLAQIVETVHPDDQAALAAAINEVIARGGPYAHQYRTRRADGNYYWLEANGHVNLAPDGTPLTFPGVLIDVEERRAVEAERDKAIAALRALTETLEQRVAERSEELMRSEEQLRQSQKMEAVGQLTGGLAHDFNNLLAVITGSLELLERRISQSRFNDIERFITASQTAAKRATSLTHRLLAFSRRQTLDPQVTDANTLIAGMADMIRRTVGPEITVEIAGAPELWTTLVDPNQLENALLNLCINARDAMPDGGRIMVEASNVALDERSAKSRDLPAGEFIVLSVSDTGTGMPPDVVARVFEPFFTTKPIGQGTGLGLSMVYGFARQSDGQVRIHSEVGKGTTINIYLPRAQGTSAAVDEAIPLKPARAEAGQTVLVVDDEANVRMLVVDVLEELGYTAIEAHDGQAGLKVLESDLRVDLLVTDVGMPGMNGRQLADAGRLLRPHLKVMFVTGYAEAAVVSHGHLEKGMTIVTKPFSLDALAQRMKALIEL